MTQFGDDFDYDNPGRVYPLRLPAPIPPETKEAREARVRKLRDKLIDGLAERAEKYLGELLDASGRARVYAAVTEVLGAYRHEHAGKALARVVFDAVMEEFKLVPDQAAFESALDSADRFTGSIGSSFCAGIKQDREELKKDWRTAWRNKRVHLQAAATGTNNSSPAVVTAGLPAGQEALVAAPESVPGPSSAAGERNPEAEPQAPQSDNNRERLEAFKIKVFEATGRKLKTYEIGLLMGDVDPAEVQRILRHDNAAAKSAMKSFRRVLKMPPKKLVDTLNRLLKKA